MNEDIRLAAIKRSIKAIENLGCKYRVVTPDGETYGDLEVPRATRGESSTAQVAPLLEGLEPGEVREVPVLKNRTVAQTQSAAALYLLHTYGKGTCMTQMKRDKVEVLRVI